jgi:hypothetical protein
MKKFFISTITFSAVLIGVLIVAAPVHAQIATNTVVTIEYPDFATAATPADLVQRIFAYAIYIAGTLAVIAIVYGGIKYIASGGNESAQKDAKEIITSAVWGIGLLAGGWVILNTINPQLVSLSNLGLIQVELRGNQTTLTPPEGQTDTGSGVGGTSIGCTTENVGMVWNVSGQGLAKLADDYLATNPSLSGSGSCSPQGGTSPSGILNAVAQGELPYVCDWGSAGTKSCSACKQGGSSEIKTLCPNLLAGLTGLQQIAGLPSFTVTSLTGGLHGADSAHYGGRAVDITVSGTLSDWQKVRDEMGKLGFTAKLEYSNNGVTKFSPGNGSDEEFFSSESSNRHIHATAGGAGSASPQDAASLLEQLKVAATEYLALSPNLKRDGTYGIPPASAQYACTAGSDPYNVVRDVSAGILPYVCNGSTAAERSDGDDTVFEAACKCQRGGVNGNMTFPDTRVLDKLKALQQMRNNGQLGIDFQVIALTGGIHLGEYNNGGHHYSGYAFDLIPLQGANISQTASEWTALLNAAKTAGGNGNITDAKFVYDYVYTSSDLTDSWIANVVTKVKQNQAATLGGAATDENNPNLLLCRAGTAANPIFFPKYLYSKYLYDEGDFEAALEEQCYNPRIRVVIN